MLFTDQKQIKYTIQLNKNSYLSLKLNSENTQCITVRKMSKRMTRLRCQKNGKHFKAEPEYVYRTDTKLHVANKSNENKRRQFLCK